jgi:hypothetical protein
MCFVKKASWCSESIWWCFDDFSAVFLLYAGPGPKQWGSISTQVSTAHCCTLFQLFPSSHSNSHLFSLPRWKSDFIRHLLCPSCSHKAPNVHSRQGRAEAGSDAAATHCLGLSWRQMQGLCVNVNVPFNIIWWSQVAFPATPLISVNESRFQKLIFQIKQSKTWAVANILTW